MNNPKLTITKFLPTTLHEKIFDERVNDWIEDGLVLNHHRQLHREKYREKICTKCNDVQKKIRNCILIGGEKRSCNHMENAVLRKFMEKAKIHSNSHPAKKI